MDFSSMLSQFKQNAAGIAAAAAAAEAESESEHSRPLHSNSSNKRPRVSSPPPETSLPDVPVRTIYLLCPARKETGGPEAMHQLCDSLNTHPSIHKAYMLYIQDTKNPSASANGLLLQQIHSPTATPISYRHYNCPAAPTLPSNIPTELIIYPECWTHLIDTFPAAQRSIWWLSVDNNHSQFQQFHRKDILHLYQSHYAKHYLLSHMTPSENILEMTEYIAPSRIPPPGAAESGFRDLDVLYNPSKGVHYTDAIRSRSEVGYKHSKMMHSSSNNSGNSNHNGNSNSSLSNSNHNGGASTSSSKMRFCAIGEGIGGRKRISPEEVTALLLRSKVYIDFGPHPGMDRLPREAALCGCIVVTNGEGAAGFPKDYPIPEEYRIRTFDTDVIHSILRKSLDEYDERKGSFDEYREFIMGQFDKMEECVKVFLNTIVDERRKAKAEDIVNRLGVADGRNVVNGGCQDDDEDDEVRSYGNAKSGDDSSLASGNDAWNVLEDDEK